MIADLEEDELRELEERLYSQIYYNNSETPTEPNDIIAEAPSNITNNQRRYYSERSVMEHKRNSYSSEQTFIPAASNSNNFVQNIININPIIQFNTPAPIVYHVNSESPNEKQTKQAKRKRQVVRKRKKKNVKKDLYHKMLEEIDKHNQMKANTDISTNTNKEGHGLDAKNLLDHYKIYKQSIHCVPKKQDYLSVGTPKDKILHASSNKTKNNEECDISVQDKFNQSLHEDINNDTLSRKTERIEQNVSEDTEDSDVILLSDVEDVCIISTDDEMNDTKLTKDVDKNNTNLGAPDTKENTESSLKCDQNLEKDSPNPQNDLDDDVIFIEPKPIEVITVDEDILTPVVDLQLKGVADDDAKEQNEQSKNITNSSTSSSSLGTPDKTTKKTFGSEASIAKENQRVEKIASERQEMMSTPESTLSNDFLDNPMVGPQNNFNFNFNLHDSDYNTFLKPKPQAETFDTESSCSFPSDVGTPSKTAVFNENEFDSSNKELFIGTNLDSFGDFITPNRKSSPKLVNSASPGVSGFVPTKASQSTPADVRDNSSDSSSESEIGESKVTNNSSRKRPRLPSLSQVGCDEDQHSDKETPPNKKQKGKQFSKCKKNLDKSKCFQMDVKGPIDHTEAVHNIKPLDETLHDSDTICIRDDEDLNKLLADINEDIDNMPDAFDSSITENNNDDVIFIEEDEQIHDLCSDSSDLSDFEGDINSISIANITTENKTPFDINIANKNMNVKKSFSQYWSDDMQKFHSESWGLENFSVTEEHKTMSDDPNLWKILDRDRIHIQLSNKRGVRCNRCREIGHYMNDCPNKSAPFICRLCGELGHQDTRCKNKLCSNCGRQGPYSTVYCKACVDDRDNKCKLCRSIGHSDRRCPDLWRRYLLTTTEGPLNKLPESQLKPINERWCSGCSAGGHFEFQCCRYNRTYGRINPTIRSYEDVYKSSNSNRRNVSDSRNSGDKKTPDKNMKVNPYAIKNSNPNIGANDLRNVIKNRNITKDLNIEIQNENYGSVPYKEPTENSKNHTIYYLNLNVASFLLYELPGNDYLEELATKSGIIIDVVIRPESSLYFMDIKGPREKIEYVRRVVDIYVNNEVPDLRVPTHSKDISKFIDKLLIKSKEVYTLKNILNNIIKIEALMKSATNYKTIIDLGIELRKSYFQINIGIFCKYDVETSRGCWQFLVDCRNRYDKCASFSLEPTERSLLQNTFNTIVYNRRTTADYRKYIDLIQKQSLQPLTLPVPSNYSISVKKPNPPPLPAVVTKKSKIKSLAKMQTTINNQFKHFSRLLKTRTLPSDISNDLPKLYQEFQDYPVQAQYEKFNNVYVKFTNFLKKNK